MMGASTYLADGVVNFASGESTGPSMSRASPEQVHEGVAHPETMAEPVFLILQRMAEIKERAAAQGQDCVPGFEEKRKEIERIMNASPWTMHPDYGCVLRAEVASRDSTAGA